MKVTYNWLKDFVDITLPPAELADRLTMAGLTVEGVEEKDGDTVFNIEVTSNRPDWLSVRGIAREVAAITGTHLKEQQRPQVPAGAEKVDVSIEDTKDCPLYTAKIVRGVKVGESPDWMKRRLELVGVRPVNNIVDITNYVLFELGEPLHAFDLDTLKSPSISVRRAKKGEKLVAIDGKEYTLEPGVLVIADQAGPVAIAGVMGGKKTEVSFSTKNVLLEAAIFNPVLTRRSRQLLALASEASYRFERGVDPCVPCEASARSCQLMAELAKGTVAGSGTSGASSLKGHAIRLELDKVKTYLGLDLEPALIKKILSSLGFEVKEETNDIFSVAVPSFRVDIDLPVDLIEEVARVYGYSRVPSELPPMVMQARNEVHLIPAVKQALMGQGLTEVLTYTLIDRKFIADFYSGSDIVEVENPLSIEQEILRPVLAPSLCRCIAYNLNQRQPSVAVFETAKTYHAPDVEKNVLGFGIGGLFNRWLGPQTGNVQYKAGFLGLKGIFDELLSRVGAPAAAYAFSSDESVSVSVSGIAVGSFRRVTGRGQDPFDIKDRELFVAEISLDALLPLARPSREFKPFLRLPSITRDITIEVKTEVPLRDVLQTARDAGTELLKDVSFRDYFDKNLPAGTKRLTISCLYAAQDRTLTEAEVAPVHEKVVQALSAAFRR